MHVARHMGYFEAFFCIILHANMSLSGPKLYDKFLQDDIGQCCITNIYACPVLSNTATYLNNSVKHTCIIIACQFAAVYLRYNVPVSILRHVKKDTPLPGTMGSKLCSMLDDTTQC